MEALDKSANLHTAIPAQICVFWLNLPHRQGWTVSSAPDDAQQSAGRRGQRKLALWPLSWSAAICANDIKHILRIAGNGEFFGKLTMIRIDGFRHKPAFQARCTKHQQFAVKSDLSP